MALSVSLSIFFGSAAIIEKQQFASVFLAGSLRLINAFGLSLFVVFFIRRSFETRDIEYMLTRPVSRAGFILSYAFGFMLIGIFTALFSALCLYVLQPSILVQGFMLWAFSIMVENIIMVSASLFFAMVLSSPASAAFATMGLYVLSRLMGGILGIIDSGKHISQFKGLELTVELVSFLTPRLDLLGQTSWLIYGPSDGFGFAQVAAIGILYTALILMAATLDLVVRKF